MVDRARFEFAPRILELCEVSRPPPLWMHAKCVASAKDDMPLFVASY
jgi:hypothetical protein